MSEGILSKKVIALIILIILIILVFLIIKPFFTAIILGFIIAFLLNWPYKKLVKLVKKKGIAAAVICLVFLIIVAVAIYFILQLTIKDAFELYLNIGKIDILTLLTKVVGWILPNYPDIANQITTAVQGAISDLINSYVQSARGIISELPKLFLELSITFLVAFYCLKDSDKILNFIREFLPFDNLINEKLITRSKTIISATLYGQVLVGIVQGVTAGIGFFLFKAQSPLFMTLLAIFFAILPLGAWIVWIPVSVTMMVTGNWLNGIFMFLFGLVIVSTIDNIVRPFIVGKKSSINPVIIFLGMIGGLILMGPVGILAGPIILEWTIIIIELYRKGNLKIKV